jgi:hypothetical protein
VMATALGHILNVGGLSLIGRKWKTTNQKGFRFIFAGMHI